MSMLLIFPLVLAILSPLMCHTSIVGKGDDVCGKQCPAGYFKVGKCEKGSKCGICPNETYTAIPNTIDECLRCATCGNYQEEVKPCYSSSNRECRCAAGYYQIHEHPSQEGIQCHPCSCQSCEDRKRKCQACEREDCRRDPKCKRVCTTTAGSPPVNASITNTTLMESAKTPSPHPESEPHFWTLIVMTLVLLVVLFCLLLLFIRLIKCLHSCSFKNTKKHGEPAGKDIEYSESGHHPGSSHTTLTVHRSEESPHPTHTSALLPDTEQRGARQEMHWPAIVLYAIIKEVPLRRWKEFLRLLAVSDQQMERVEMEAGLGLGSVEKQYQMLRLWSQRSSASLSDVFSALHYMDLSGCAQLLQDSLKNLQWEEEPRQDLTAC